MGHKVGPGYSVHHCDRFMYLENVYACNMFVLHWLLNKKNKKGHL